MKTKLICILLCFVLIFSAFALGCGKKDGTAASSDGNTISVEITLKNYGFSPAYGIESGFALLNEKFEPVSQVVSGEPDKWYSHDPKDPESTVVPEYIVDANLDAPKENGKYYLAFYLKNGMGQYAKLSNNDESVPFVGEGYNILYTFGE